jgi:predicted nucleotidyltransferase
MITSIAVFGSIQRKEERASSDIDLLVLVGSSDEKKPAEESFNGINDAIVSKFSNVIAPYIQTVNEFKAGHTRKLGVTENIIKSHELIYGKPLKELL